MANRLFVIVRALLPDPDVEELWAEEAERRWREIESGSVATIPWEEVRAKLFRRG